MCEHKSAGVVATDYRVTVICNECDEDVTVDHATAVDLLRHGQQYKEAAIQGARYITDFVSMGHRGRLDAFERLFNATQALPGEVWGRHE